MIDWSIRQHTPNAIRSDFPWLNSGCHGLKASLSSPYYLYTLLYASDCTANTETEIRDRADKRIHYWPLDQNGSIRFEIGLIIALLRSVYVDCHVHRGVGTDLILYYIIKKYNNTPVSKNRRVRFSLRVYSDKFAITQFENDV